MDICISQRMHGCIACVLSNTPLIAVDLRIASGRDDAKISDLMRSCNLSQFCYRPSLDSPSAVEAMIADLTNGAWPADAVKTKREALRRRSQEFTDKIRTLADRVHID